MVSREMIQIILQAQDQASQVIKQNEQNMKRFGTAAQQANQKAGSSSQNFTRAAQQASHKVNEIVKSSERVGQIGPKQFDRYSNSIQKGIVNFHRLDTESQNMLRYMSQMSAKGRETFVGISSKAQEAIAKFQALENETRTWGNTFDFTKTKMQLMGTDVDSLKGKVQVFGASFSSYVTPKIDSVANSIRSKISSALSAVRSKVETLGSAFSGLGGLISSAIGGLGMASITDMTVGLAMNRERMTALTSATMGSASAGQEFVGVMNELTNNSLVSLDDLGQAMSTIKMSTGMSNDQLKDFTTTVNDVGQRAILMGKSGDEAMALMQAAGRGLNDEFDMLKTNFGVTKDQLEQLGWSGAADDVEGYQKALDKALESGGSMDGMMDTSVGHLETLKKNFRIAGRHVGDMFTPAIDQAVVGLNQLNDTCPGLFEGLVEIAGGVSMFASLAPTISPMLTAFDSLVGKGKGVLRFLGLLEAEEGALTLATLRESAAQKISAATKYLSGIATATYGAIVGVLTGEITLATAAQQIWNAVMAANPIGLIIIAVAALAVAVYELGKMWGWWSDVGSMLDAIKSGLTRLWNAFINNPNVQGFIKGIGEAWKQLQEMSKPVIDWLSGIWDMIFPQAATEKWDAVRIIIEAIGLAFTVLTLPIRNIISLFQVLYPYMQEFYTSTLVPFGSFLSSVFAPVWTLISQVIHSIIPIVGNLSNAFTQFSNGQISLPTLIWTVLTSLWKAYTTIFGLIIKAVISWGKQIIAKAISAVTSFVLNIMNRVKQLPSKMLSELLLVVNVIKNAIQRWITAAVAKVRELIDSIINPIKGIAGSISSALSGVADAFTKPFRDAWAWIEPYYNKIKDALNIIPGGAWGGETAYGGETAMTNLVNSIVTGGSQDKIEVEVKEEIVLDLKNVPSHIDTDTLIKMLQDKEVLRALTGNKDFQYLDGQMKDALLSKVNRAKGV